MTELLGCEQTLCVLALKDSEALLVAPHRVDDGALVHHNVDFSMLAFKDGEAHQAEIQSPWICFRKCVGPSDPRSYSPAHCLSKGRMSGQNLELFFISEA